MTTTEVTQSVINKLHRYTYVEINLNNIKKNVKKIINHAPKYDYYFSVVKADSYGHKGIKPVKKTIEGGCNYLAVSNLDEALKIRQYIKHTPILCFGFININDIYLCEENNITISINSFKYLKDVLAYYKDIKKISNASKKAGKKPDVKGEISILNEKYHANLKEKSILQQSKKGNLKAHIKLNTGMNRLGLSDKDKVTKAYKLLMKSPIELEGIYTHIFHASNKKTTQKQYRKFEELTENIDLSKIKIVHINASDATLRYEKLPYANGCRLGIAMYGLSDVDLGFHSTFKLYSEVIQINEVKKGFVGYSAGYKTVKKERIAVIPIGYDDGIIRMNTGREVFINNKAYKIVGNICMDMLFVKVDEAVKIKDKVTIIRDNDHIKKIAKHLKTIPYEVICNVGKRVPRLYINE